MSDVSVKDFKIYSLQQDYIRYSEHITKLQDHIELCYADCIFNINDRNSYLKQINDFLRQMNLVYNKTMTKLEEQKEPEEPEKPENKVEIKDKDLEEFETLYDLATVYKMLNIDVPKYNYVLNSPFDDIKSQILSNLCLNVGFKNVKQGLDLIIGRLYRKQFDKETVKLIDLYSNIFIPISYKIEENNCDSLQIANTDVNNDVLLENCATVQIKNILFTGYFKTDPLNLTVRTSQISNNFIYQKKKLLEQKCLNTIVDEKFCRSYLRNSHIHDILALTDEQYVKKLEDNYNVYTNLIKLSFMNIMKEFVKNDKNDKLNIKHMYTVIRLLLLGSEDNVNVAGLLYGIAKEKKPGYDMSISDIIYNNLSYNSQMRLKKTAVNIKAELEKIKNMSVNDVDLKKQLAISTNMPNNVKKAALEKIDEMKSSNNEYYKQLLYVKTLLNYPWPSSDEDTSFVDLGKSDKKSQQFLDSVVNNLDRNVYGHEECKTSIKELIGKWIKNPSSSGTAIGLVGPPGVGKTLIAKAIGEALNIPFVQITLGGQNDGELLHGHGYTYSGAQPGMVVKKMVEAGSARCIMYFDELDKACKKHDSNEIYNILIHMVDPNTNQEFQDRFFQEVNFPLNKVLFIFSYNDSNVIDNILMDRIKEIDVKPFKLQDKRVITNKFLIKEMGEVVGFENGSVKLNDETIDFIIDEYTHEPGVRELKRKLEKIFLKLNIDRIYKKGLFSKNKKYSVKTPLTLKKEVVNEYLGKQNVKIQHIHAEDTVGVINGLYATVGGKGGVLPIQVYCNYTGGDDKFLLKLTGSQKRVMRESVISAFTAAIHVITSSLRESFFKNNPHGFHIHTPSGAVPKDGPSAGCAFATAFVSRILNKKIKRDVAITGEIELTGKVTKIGGLQYKLTGAKRAGVKLVMVSKENEEDVDNLRKEYPDIFTGDFTVMLVNNIRDVLTHALVDFNHEDCL